MGDLIIFPRHMTQANLCTRGARAWFARRGWPWGEFVAEGRPAQDFIETGDPLAMRPVEAARKESEGGQ